MDFIQNILVATIIEVWVSLQHNWLYLLISVLIATSLRLYVDTARISSFLQKNRSKGVFAATAVAVATPLCSCGTTAVVLGMMATTMPWTPIIAFMVSSPLSSPEGLVYSAGIFGWPFAITFFVISILLGLAGGWVAGVLERRGWLDNQTRFTSVASSACDCPQPEPLGAISLPVLVPVQAQVACCAAESSLPVPSVSLASQPQPEARPKLSTGTFLKELYNDGKKLLGMFLGFAFIGYFLNGLIPQAWISALFGSGNLYNVPLAATLGLPFYINSEASLPLVRAMIDNGMSQGAALAFIISGAGTSIGAVTGALTIARWRVVALVVAILWVGAILGGLAYNWLLLLNLF